jgi:hypothetical protein
MPEPVISGNTILMGPLGPPLPAKASAAPTAALPPAPRLPPAVDVPNDGSVVLCNCKDKLTGEACGEPATASYMWGWGETGTCCARHQFLLAQLAKPLKRQIQFSALAPSRPAPMLRDERVQLHAQRLAAEEELAESKANYLTLYDQKEALRKELASKAALVSHHEATIKDQNRELAHLREDLEEVVSRLGGAMQELTELRALADALEAKPSPIQPEPNADADLAVPVDDKPESP